MNDTKKNVCVVVLGDIGRSPRMQYHSLSLAQNGQQVDIIGYGETPPMNDVLVEPQIYHHYLQPPVTIGFSKALNYVVKTIWQAVTLFFVLLIIRKPDVIIVQNPPAVPSLLVCWFYARITKANFIIDWHNYAHTIMALSVGSGNILVKVTKKIEQIIGRKADYNFCVTNAMRKDLKENWNIEAITLYDRPPEQFRTISLKEKHEVLSCLGLKYKELVDENSSNTRFTEVDELGEIKLKEGRPGLLISSTSWTEDEDFSVLLSALQIYEDHITNGNVRNLPRLVCIITGKGPLKDYYCDKLRTLKWKNVKVITPWLEAKDYPLLLASADLGVCLHTSSSGLDLPMKVVDMFGCLLPVCAYDFKCLDELIQHNRNSYIFKDTNELAEHVLNWFESFSNDENYERTVMKFKKELKKFQDLRWSANWNSVALPVFIK